MDQSNDPIRLGGDAWSELQAFKNRQLNRRERLNRHKDLINGLNQLETAQKSTIAQVIKTTTASASPKHTSIDDSKFAPDIITQSTIKFGHESANKLDINSGVSALHSKTLSPPVLSNKLSSQSLEIVECLLLDKLCEVGLKLPLESKVLLRYINRIKGLEKISQSLVDNLLEKFAHQELITIEEPSASSLSSHQRINRTVEEESCIYLTSADHTKLVELNRSFSLHNEQVKNFVDCKISDEPDLNKYPNSHHERLISSLTHQNSVGNQAQHPGKKSSNNSDDRFEAETQVKQNSHNSNIDIEHVDRALSKQNSLTSGTIKSDDLESLLSLSSTRERESQKLGEELLELLSKPTAKERNLLESFRSADGYQVQEFCPRGTREECNRKSKIVGTCNKLHFKKIIAKHTEESLGDCSFLNTCFHMDSCKYVHYEVDYNDDKHSINQQASDERFKRPKTTIKKANINLTQIPQKSSAQTVANPSLNIDRVNESQIEARSNPASPNSQAIYEELLAMEARTHKRYKTVLYPAQWIQCDLRFFDMTLLGKFSVVMADPPWDIHMELPYGTMSDDEMRKLNIPALQDEGVIFLWVTGRAMELGRECLSLWGYERCDEVIWVKTNQLQRIIRTGRTGHWLNHGKEHCLVGVKGNPTDINRGLDCDVIVAEVRATSHKPDEIYGIIERLSPGSRKIELFGRPHNVQPNWITLGNQLNGVKIIDPNLIDVFKRMNLPYQHDGPI